MNPDDATRLLALLSAGFPRQDWPDSFKRLWREELQPVGAIEGLAAARAVVRGHEFLSFRAFYDELARVRETALDQHNSDTRLALNAAPSLEPGERWLDAPANRRHLAELKMWLNAKAVSDRRILAPEAPRAPMRQRFDETYFNEPEPGPPAPAESPDHEEGT